MEDDENIMFDEMPNIFGNMFEREKSPICSDSAIIPKTYNSLYEELCDKCFPERYMEPYNATLVSAATKLYSEVLKSEGNINLQNELRHKAYKELGVILEGSKLYHYLMDYLNPRLYLNPFVPDKLETANKYYPEIENNKDDYIYLEDILHKVQWFIDAINEEKEMRRKEEEEFLKSEEQVALRSSEDDKQWLEDVRNSLGEENWRKYVEEEYGGYIKE